MAYVDLETARLWYEERGAGRPLVLLHGGWGERAMPFDEAVATLSCGRRVIRFDRRGYGRSTPLDRLGIDYHLEAATDLRAFLAALGLTAPDARPVLWGHSDGAIIAAYYAAAHPEDVAAVVLEAVHFHRTKSLPFFERLAADPEALPERTRRRLEDDHGERWPEVVRMHSLAWIELGRRGGDFYEGRLERIRCPALILHGARDIHTPVSEVEEIHRRLADAELEVLPEGEHSPHSESATAAACWQSVERFLAARGL